MKNNNDNSTRTNGQLATRFGGTLVVISLIGGIAGGGIADAATEGVYGKGSADNTPTLTIIGDEDSKSAGSTSKDHSGTSIFDAISDLEVAGPATRQPSSDNESEDEGSAPVIGQADNSAEQDPADADESQADNSADNQADNSAEQDPVDADEAQADTDDDNSAEQDPYRISVGYGDDVYEALVEGAGYFGDTPEIFQQRAMAVLSFLVAISGDPVNELQDPPAVDGPRTVTSEFTDEEYTNWVPRANAHLVADAEVSLYVATYLLIFLTSLS